MSYSKRVANFYPQKIITTNNSVNFLFLYCFFGLHLTLKFDLRLNFFSTERLSHYLCVVNRNDSLINVFLQANI